jgi:hypothetical protein
MEPEAEAQGFRVRADTGRMDEQEKGHDRGQRYGHAAANALDAPATFTVRTRIRNQGRSYGRLIIGAEGIVLESWPLIRRRLLVHTDRRVLAVRIRLFPWPRSYVLHALAIECAVFPFVGDRQFQASLRAAGFRILETTTWISPWGPSRLRNETRGAQRGARWPTRDGR